MSRVALQLQHVALDNGLRTKAKVYCDGFIREIIAGSRESLAAPSKTSFSYPAEEDLDDDDPDEEYETWTAAEPLEPAVGLEPPSKGVIQKLHRVHATMGHPENEQFMRLLKAARANSSALSYVQKSFRCEVCSSATRPKAHRRAATPRTYELSRIIAVDFFFLQFHGAGVPVPNIICCGTNFQICAITADRSSEEIWKTFN